MQKVKLTEEGLWNVKRTGDDIYNMYTTEEVLTMDNVSEKEKKAVNEIFRYEGVLGWIESIESKEYNKIFIQIYEGNILKYVDQIEKREGNIMKLIMDDGREITLSEEAQEILKKEISQSKEVKNFSKEEDTRYWYINSYGEILDNAGIIPIDKNSLNEFTNKEFAEKIAFKQLMERKLLKFKEEYDNVNLDWDDKDKIKYRLSYNEIDKEIETSSNYNYKQQGSIYFSSREIAEKCIEMYKDDLIKYFQLDIW